MPVSSGVGAKELFAVVNRFDETVASTWDILNVAAAIATIAENLAESAHIGAQVGFVDPNTAPNGFNELVLCDDFAGILEQDLKQPERTAADAQRLIAVKQLLTRWHKAECAERQYLFSNLHHGPFVRSERSFSHSIYIFSHFLFWRLFEKQQQQSSVS